MECGWKTTSGNKHNATSHTQSTFSGALPPDRLEGLQKSSQNGTHPKPKCFVEEDGETRQTDAGTQRFPRLIRDKPLIGEKDTHNNTQKNTKRTHTPRREMGKSSSSHAIGAKRHTTPPRLHRQGANPRATTNLFRATRTVRAAFAPSLPKFDDGVEKNKPGNRGEHAEETSATADESKATTGSTTRGVQRRQPHELLCRWRIGSAGLIPPYPDSTPAYPHTHPHKK